MGLKCRDQKVLFWIDEGPIWNNLKLITANSSYFKSGYGPQFERDFLLMISLHPHQQRLWRKPKGRRITYQLEDQNPIKAVRFMDQGMFPHFLLSLWFQHGIYDFMKGFYEYGSFQIYATSGIRAIHCWNLWEIEII